MKFQEGQYITCLSTSLTLALFTFFHS